MPKSIHHNPDQCTFDFDALSSQPVETLTHTEPTDTPQVKQCFKCQQWFPANSTYYTKHPQKKDGWNPSCKGCKNGKPIVIKEIIPEGMKQCSKCKKVYDATNANFAVNKSTPDGFHGNCKVCVNAYAQIYNDSHKEEHARYRQEHIEEIKEKKRQWYEIIKEEIRPIRAANRAANKEILNERRRRARRERGIGTESARRYRQEHKEEINARRRTMRPTRKEEINARRKERYHLHRDKWTAYYRLYQQSHKESTREYKKLWYQAHKDGLRDKRRVYNRAYYRTEHGNLISRVKSHKRRAIKKHTQGSLTPQQIQGKLKSQKHRCYYAACGHAKFKKSKGRYVYHIEHVVPISRTEHNPRHDADNIVLACPACNLKKGAKLPSEWPDGGRLF